MLIGYARVSTTDQDLTLQLDALRSAGCERIFEDKASGKTIDREGLRSAIDYMRPGDTLVVWKLDRLGRSVRGLLKLSAELDGKGIHLSSLTEKLDTTNAHGRFFFTMMAAFAEMERALISERTKAGLDAARRYGKTLGRGRIQSATLSKAEGLLLRKTYSEVAKELGISRATLYRYFPAKDNTSH